MKSNKMPSLEELEKITAICSVLAKAPFYQKIGPGGTLAIWLTALEMGLPVMACLNGGLHTFDGKVTMAAQLKNALIIKAGHRVDILTLTDEECELLFWRNDRPKGNDTFRYKYTLKRAEKAGLLTKTNWKTSVRDMLFSRCLSGGANKFLPDVLMSLGSLDEDFIEDPAIEQEEKKELTAVENDLLSFKERFQIGQDSIYDSFVDTLCKGLNKQKEEVLISAQMNESGFVEAFEKWNQKMQKQKEEKETKEILDEKIEETTNLEYN